MSDRIFTWHEPGVMSETNVVGTNTKEEYTTDKTYVPERVILRLKTPGATDGDALTIDINDDGASIFDVNPTIGQGLTEAIVTSFKSTLVQIAKDSVLTLDIDQVSGTTAGNDLTVQLDLAEAD